MGSSHAVYILMAINMAAVGRALVAGARLERPTHQVCLQAALEDEFAEELPEDEDWAARAARRSRGRLALSPRSFAA
eukprot:10432459-Alexandrium_andersonii.AAC.1